jgi:hypothetical protein
MTATSLNFALLDADRPEVARLIAAMVQARDAVEHRSWSDPQEPSGDEWWADCSRTPPTDECAVLRTCCMGKVMGKE